MTRPGERLLDLVAVMDRLRSPGGCPWDARQTHASLVEYLVEEAYETVEAIETADSAALREELGDLLLQVVFHARIAEESVPGWGIDEVAGGIVDKLIARHPHVFDDAGGADLDADEVEAQWHARKAQQKGRAALTDGIPEALPALVRAGKVITRTAGIAAALPPLPRADEATRVVGGLASPADLGDLLLAVVAAARVRGWDAESATRDAVRRRIAVAQDA